MCVVWPENKRKLRLERVTFRWCGPELHAALRDSSTEPRIARFFARGGGGITPIRLGGGRSGDINPFANTDCVCVCV